MLATGAHQIDGHKESRLLSTQTQASVVKSKGQFPGSRKREKRLDIYSFCIENMVCRKLFSIKNNQQVLTQNYVAIHYCGLIRVTSLFLSRWF